MDLTFFRCLGCERTGAPHAGDASLTCPSCGRQYPVVNDVPLLVRDWEGHRDQIDRARSTHPTWYEHEQPPEVDSPWRHHLEKRRLYVEGVLRRHTNGLGGGRPSRLLDLGCGDGNNLVWLSEFADSAYGSDYNVVRLSRARARCKDATLFLADVLDYPACDGFYDVVFFNHVIEHIREDETALSAIHRILAPGGLLILGTPNEGAWWWQLAYRRAPETLETTDHVHFYTADSIAAKMRAAGFDLVEVEHLGWGPPDWHWDGRLRQHKVLDDLFEWVGRRLLPRQASSLYLIAVRQ